MEPIISPVWIYLINVANRIWVFSIFTLLVAMFMILSLMAGWIVFYGPDSEKVRSRWIKTFVIVMIVCMIIIVLFPNKDTMYAMLAASFITPDNISEGEEHLIDLVTKIANIIHNAPK